MSQHQGPTDKTTKITLSSSIEQVMWARQVAAAGAQVRLEVFTHFVGNGAALQIELTDATGKSLGTFKDELYGNRFWANLAVPLNAKDALFAEVKLPKHGLKQKSAPLLVTPPVEITNLKWSAPEARRGDILKLTAGVRGAYDGTDAEISIWEHDADGAHDLITKLPTLVNNKIVEAEWEFEYHEDTDDIPAVEELEQGYSHPEYFFRVSVAGVTAESDLLKFKDWIEIEMINPFGSSLEGEKYILYLADGAERSGMLDAAGRAREENIPPGPYEVNFPGKD